MRSQRHDPSRSVTTTTRGPRGVRWRLLTLAAVPAVGLALLAGCTGTSAPLPTGYPSADVPVASGDVTSTGTLGDGWTVEVRVADADAQKNALETLKRHGFQVIGQSSTTGPSIAYSLASARYSVRLELRTDDKNFDLVYGVAPRTTPTAAPTSTPTRTATPKR